MSVLNFLRDLASFKDSGTKDVLICSTLVDLIDDAIQRVQELLSKRNTDLPRNASKNKALNMTVSGVKT